MPGLLGNPPMARPMPAAGGAARPGVTLGLKPDSSVGIGTSSAPYGPTNGYATPGGVTGFSGPAAGSLWQPSSWYVRAGGSNNNGGSSSSLSPDQSGSDGALNSSGVFSSASATFTTANVGQGVCIDTGASARRFRITGWISATQLQTTLLGVTLSGKNWALGGAWADMRAAVGDAVVSQSGAQQNAVWNGDTIYVGAGSYRVVPAMSTFWFGGPPGVNANNGPQNYNGTIAVVGDYSGAHTGDAGPVIFTGYTTDDKTAPSGNAVLTFNGKANLAFSNIVFVSGNATLIDGTTATSRNVTFTDCSFFSASNGSGILVSVTAAYLAQLNWLFDRCSFMTGRSTSGGVFTVTCTSGNAGDYDVNLTIQNSVMFCNGTAILVQASGALAGHGGGVRVFASTFWLTAAMQAATATSTIFPSRVVGCLIYAGNTGTALIANSSGQITEDYNLIVATTARNTVSVGANSISNGSYAPLVLFGQERIWGGLPRPFGEPMAGSPLLGWNPAGQAPDTTPAIDALKRWRPTGSTTPVPAIGPLERGNTAAQGTSPSPPSGTHVWKGTGPWQQDWLLPVAAAADGFSISVQRDSSYVGTNPTLEILANPAIGVSYQKVTDTGAAGGWNTLTAAGFTPTAVGWVTVRVTSYDASGASVVAFAVANPS